MAGYKARLCPIACFVFFSRCAAALAVSPASAASARISSSQLTLGISTTAGGAVSVDTFTFFGAGANTSNLALGGGGLTSSSTLLVPHGQAGSGKGAIVPQCLSGCTLNSTATSITVTGLDVGGFASETWSLTLLNTTAFEWRVDRVYRSNAPALGVDRLALSLSTTGGQPIHSEQIPGFVDLDMFLNDTSTGGFDIGNGAYEYLSPTTRQFVRFTPTGALFVVEGAATSGGAVTPTLWSFAKPFADGTTWCSIGFETIDPRAAPGPAPTSGATSSLSMRFNLVESDIPTDGKGAGPFPKMDVLLANATLGTQMAQLLGAQYQLMGYVMGNNPASSPCLHEMAWWPMMASLFPAGSIAFAAMQKELSFFASCGWAPYAWLDHPGEYQFVHSCNMTDGARFGMTQRYASSGFYNAPWGPLSDENVMFPIAVYYTATSTGDMPWLQSLLPALRTIETYLASAGLTLAGKPGTPVIFISPGSGIADAGRHATNWYDIVLFGHMDALLAAYGVWALSCLQEIYTALGDSAGASRVASIHGQAVIDFNTAFWNAGNRSYHDWIDVQGKARSYYFVDVAFVAIIAGIANATQATALLDHYDSRLADIYTEYDVTPGTIWSAPCNLYLISDPKEFANDVHAPVAFPSYENGGSFFHTPGLQFSALGVAGRPDAAYDGFVALLNSGFGRIRGWAQQLYWSPNRQPERLVGGDPLNTAALSIWGFMRTSFGAAPTLTRGVVAVNKPAAAAMGSRWNVSVLGENVCLVVGDGVTTFCNGSALQPL